MSDYIIHNGTLMSEELYHYGVKGMKWGHRKRMPTDGGIFKKRQAPSISADGGGIAGKKVMKPDSVVDPNTAKVAGAVKNHVVNSVKNRRANTESGAHNKDYTDKQRKRDRAFYGNRGEKRINKKLNEGYGLQGARHFEAERRQRNDQRKKTAKKVAKKGAAAVGSVLGTVGMLYVRDQVFNGGRGTEAAKKAVKNIGRAAVTAYTKARGGYDIHWYDN